VPRRRQPRQPLPPDYIAAGGYIRGIALLRDQVHDFDVYPYNLPAVRSLDRLELHAKVTFLIGENGTGKSTLIEAMAVAAGFNAEGGSRNFHFSTRQTESELHTVLRLVRSPRRPHDGFFLRAESLYNVATQLEDLDRDDEGAGFKAPRLMGSYGGRSLHAQSHGESFLALAMHRFRGQGIYFLDEPEAALSPFRQLALLALVDDHVQKRASQFIVATHSPILMAYPDATIYELSVEHGVRTVAYEDTDHFQLTRDFLNDRQSFFAELFSDPRGP
jgi:predicted ATPase